MAVITRTQASPSAPTLTGLAGAMIGVLDYCLTDATYGIGWTKQYSGTNKAVYRQKVGTNQFYLRVDDTGTINSGVRGYESMSDVDTGTGPFPTTAQAATFSFKKSATSDSVARNWSFTSNGDIFYLTVYSNGAASQVVTYCFGDFVSYRSGDAYNTVICGTTSVTDGSSTTSSFTTIVSSLAATEGVFYARAHTQIGGSLQGGKHVDSSKAAGATGMGAGGGTYPDPLSGGINLSKVWLNEPSTAVRGELPGIWSPLHTKPIGAGDTFSGTGDLAGKTFVAVNNAISNQFIVETSDTW